MRNWKVWAGLAMLLGIVGAAAYLELVGGAATIGAIAVVAVTPDLNATRPAEAAEQPAGANPATEADVRPMVPLPARTSDWDLMWQSHFNDQIKDLVASHGWPLRVEKRSERMIDDSDVKVVTLRFREIGGGGHRYWLEYRVVERDHLDDPYIGPFRHIVADDRVRFDSSGWPHRVAVVWVHGSRFGYRQSDHQIPLPENWEESTPIIPLD